MNAPRWPLAMLLLFVAGCRGAGTMDVAERELRTQEDRIYQLQEYIDKYQAMLESCRRENEALRRELGVDGETDGPPTRGPRSAPRGSTPPRRGGQAPPTDMEFQPPVIEPGEPTTPEGPFVPGPEGDSSLPAPGSEDSASAVSTAPVASLKLNPRLTGGLDIDGQPGDDGVMVVIEPHSTDGQLTRPLGTVSILVVDPAKDGAASRIARWDFTSDEAAAAWKKTVLGHGMHFELPWPGDGPRARQLRLHVRLVTPQGEKFLAERDIDVDLVGIPAASGAPQWAASKRTESADVVRAGHNSAVRGQSATADRRASQWQLRPLASPKETAGQPDEVGDLNDEPPTGVRSTKPGRSGSGKEGDKAANSRPEWQPYR